MYPKLLAIVIGLVLIGAGMLALRNRRLEMRHEMTRVHGRMNDTRKRIWTVQTRIAEKTTPQALQRAVHEAGLKLEPVTEFDIAQPGSWPGVGPRFVKGYRLTGVDGPNNGG